MQCCYLRSIVWPLLVVLAIAASTNGSIQAQNPGLPLAQSQHLQPSPSPQVVHASSVLSGPVPSDVAPVPTPPSMRKSFTMSDLRTMLSDQHAANVHARPVDLIPLPQPTPQLQPELHLHVGDDSHGVVDAIGPVPVPVPAPVPAPSPAHTVSRDDPRTDPRARPVESVETGNLGFEDLHSQTQTQNLTHSWGPQPFQQPQWRPVLVSAAPSAAPSLAPVPRPPSQTTTSSPTSPSVSGRQAYRMHIRASGTGIEAFLQTMIRAMAGMTATESVVIKPGTKVDTLLTEMSDRPQVTQRQELQQDHADPDRTPSPTRKSSTSSSPRPGPDPFTSLFNSRTPSPARTERVTVVPMPTLEEIDPLWGERGVELPAELAEKIAATEEENESPAPPA